MSAVIEEVQATTYKIRGLQHGAWADITIREWEGGGAFDCQSDYGNYSYSWGAIGKRTLRQFLCGLDKDYFFGKTMGRRFEVFDLAESCNRVRRDICRERYGRSLTKEEARKCWDEMENIASDSGESSDLFCDGIGKSSIWEKVYGGCYECVPFVTIDHPQATAFWEVVWPVITGYWRKQFEGTIR